MKYFEVTFSVNPCNETATDILSALIAETGFDIEKYNRRVSYP